MSSKKTVILGTRGSALALAQVEMVRAALLGRAPGLGIEVCKITTQGDRRQQPGLIVDEAAGLKGLFTKEIEQVLLDGRIDVAVHSLKDLPGQIPEELQVRAVLERADTADLIISKGPIGAGSTIGTSSVRRRHQLLWERKNLKVVEIRGNVPTRLQKLRESAELDGIVLARAGLVRLGIDPAAQGFEVEVLESFPAIGQGAIALECRRGDLETAALLDEVNHVPTHLCIRAERELLRLLDGDCRLPVGARTTLHGQQLEMKVVVFSTPGIPPRLSEAVGDAAAPEELARKVFEGLTKD